MKPAKSVPGVFLVAAMLASGAVPSRADAPLAGARLIATAPAQVFCSSPQELAAYTAAVIRHDPIKGLYLGCSAVLRGTPVQVTQDLGPRGYYFHIVRATAVRPFPLRALDAYTYSVGLSPNYFDSSLPPYNPFPFP